MSRGAPSFALVALDAGGDDVIPRFLSALYAWYDVVEGELDPRSFAAAVLAGELISKQYVGAREANDILLPSERDEFQQAEDGRQLERHADGANLAFPLLNDFDFSLENKLNGFLPVHNQEGLKRSVQNQHMVHNISIFST